MIPTIAGPAEMSVLHITLQTGRAPQENAVMPAYPGTMTATRIPRTGASPTFMTMITAEGAERDAVTGGFV